MSQRGRCAPLKSLDFILSNGDSLKDAGRRWVTGSHPYVQELMLVEWVTQGLSTQAVGNAELARNAGSPE